MDGYDAKTYDCFRGVAGSFDATIRGIAIMILTTEELRNYLRKRKWKLPIS